ncbi:MAG: hypothetical protein HC772_18975 [Leptolyngbyaceae cyanobacterium CRU_2_3]|nr:hypothetical protein [Leptolyngbyaceae cyanobacterium CRU_2_3]
MTVALHQRVGDRVAEFVETLRAQGIKQVRFEFTDLHGVSRSKLVPIDAVEGFSRKGLNFYGGMMGLDTGSQIVPQTGLHEDMNYRDGVIMPDFETLTPIPWLDHQARVMCDYEWSPGVPIESYPRYVFKRVLTKRQRWDLM